MILEVGVFFVAIGLIITALGYNLTLPGYSRKKMLEGRSVHYQMLERRRTGAAVMQIGIITMSISAFFIFVVFGLFLEMNRIETVPKKVDIMIAQGKTVIMADGEVKEFSKAHYHIRRIYFRQKLNVYKFDCVGSFRELIVEDQQDQWEVLRR
jgi:hypothetical protein